MTTKERRRMTVAARLLLPLSTGQRRVTSRGKFTGVGSGIVERLAAGWGGT